MSRGYHMTVLAVLVLAAVWLLVLTAPVAATPAPPEMTCGHCLSTGYAYRCQIPITSTDCFYLAGDAHCVGTECTCCRLEYAKGCERCETADDADLVEDDAELLGEDL